jgi:hypothetical protein
MLMKRYFFVLLLFAIGSITQSYAQQSSKIPQDFCISQQEYRLYTLINEYRARLALDAIPLSRSLCFVARTHAKDLSANYPLGDGCNMHSWSDKGNWKAFCFPKDQNRKNDIKDKAKEITNYPGKAYELTYWENSEVDVAFVLDFWNSIPYTGDMISNINKWSKKAWKSMGVGIQDGYVLVWLGQSVDVEISTQICETGEKIMNQSIPNEVIAPVTKKSVSASSFYIIIGSFNARSDAQSAVDSYHQMGYPNAVVIESQGRVRVAIDVFKTQDLADRSLERYRTKFQGAWVFSEK